MKTTSCLALLALAGSAVAGVTSNSVCQSSDAASCRSREHICGWYRDAGTPGTFYHSNLGRDAVICINDTPHFTTFFVYFGDMPGSNDVNDMIRIGAYVYQVIVPPYQKSFIDQRGRCYWVGSKPGKWGIDPTTHRLGHTP